MQDITLTAKSHLDFSGLGELKAKAKQDQKGAAQEVGRQFEAMFVQMIFKSMREANETMKSDLLNSSNADTFEQMYHDELSQVMAQQGVFGLGDWLVEQVNGQPNITKAIKAYEQTPLPSMPLNGADIVDAKRLSSYELDMLRRNSNG
jgi:flagellar protein FlgJ